jgi:hypothetical protein
MPRQSSAKRITSLTGRLIAASALAMAFGTVARASEPEPMPPVSKAATTSDQPSRSTPEARLESRGRFAEQSDGQALASLRAQHPGLVQRAWRASAAKGGHEVERYVGDFAAVLDVGEGHKTLAESILPLRTTTASGERVPVDFALEDRGAYVAPRAPLVAVRLPKRLEDGIELVEDGVSVSPVAASGGVALGAEGSLFWGNAWGRDTDVIATPLPWGVQVLGQLRSVDSPEDFDLRIGLPAGARAQRAAGGEGVEVMRGTERVATISAPVAFDADGVRVAASYVLEGETMRIHVGHRGEDLRYPLILDPVLAEDQRHWHENAAMDFTGWESGSVGGTFNVGAGSWWMGRGLVIADADAFYNNGNWAFWRFNAPGSESFIYAADFHYVRTSDQDTCLDEGISDGLGGWAVYNRWCNASLNYVSHGNCAAPGCPANAVGRPNRAYFMTMAAYYNKYRDAFSHFTGGALLWLNDLTAPTLSNPGATTTSTWADNEPRTLLPLGVDWGLGIKQWKLSLPGQPDRYRTHDCAGHRNDRCPNTGSSATTGVSPNALRTSGDSFTYSTGVLPEGIVQVRGYAGDFTGNWSPPKTDELRVDHTPPTVELSGSLSDQDGETLDSSMVYYLRVDAADGMPSAPRAGVKSIEIQLDGLRQDFVEQGCAAGSCSLTRDWRFAPAGAAPGRHVVKVIASDQLGHTKTREFEFDVPPSPGCDPGPSSLGPDLSVSDFETAACPTVFDRSVDLDARLRLVGVPGGYVGGQVTDVGDVNGDGRPDLAMGSPQLGNTFYVVFGRTAPPDSTSVGPNASAISLGSVNASGGFRIDGSQDVRPPGAPYSHSYLRGLGDVNGDGLADLAISSSATGFNGRPSSGSVFVVFGKPGTSNVNLTSLGSGGYRIDGAAAYDDAGEGLSDLGDVNGDGRADLLIGAPGAGNNGTNSGSVYVVFGKATTTTLDLASLGVNGYRIDGLGYSRLGWHVFSAGDVNCDAKPDILVGDDDAGFNGRDGSGSAYVVYGKGSTANVNLASLGAGGFRIDGAAVWEGLGGSGVGVGDLNDDGCDDIAIGATNHASGLSVYSRAYVIFGDTRAGGVIDSRNLAATDGYRIDGIPWQMVKLARIDDVNNDGRAELAVWTAFETANVIYGKTDGATVDLRSPTFPGYRLTTRRGTRIDKIANARGFLGDGAPYVAVGDTAAPSDPLTGASENKGVVSLVSARPRL